jgi:hypothetical protein
MSDHAVRDTCRAPQGVNEHALNCRNTKVGHFTPREMPIIHSANSADSQGRPPGPGWAGGGAGQPRTRSQRRIAGRYSLHRLPGRAASRAAASILAPLWWPLPGRPPRLPCPRGEVPVSGVGSSRPRPPGGTGATQAAMTPISPACRLLPDGRVTPSLPCRSGAVSPAIGVGSSRGGASPGKPGTGGGLPGEGEQAVAAMAGPGVGRA